MSRLLKTFGVSKQYAKEEGGRNLLNWKKSRSGVGVPLEGFGQESIYVEVGECLTRSNNEQARPSRCWARCDSISLVTEIPKSELAMRGTVTYLMATTLDSQHCEGSKAFVKVIQTSGSRWSGSVSSAGLYSIFHAWFSVAISHGFHCTANTLVLSWFQSVTSVVRVFKRMPHLPCKNLPVQSITGISLSSRCAMVSGKLDLGSSPRQPQWEQAWVQNRRVADITQFSCLRRSDDGYPVFGLPGMDVWVVWCFIIWESSNEPEGPCTSLKPVWGSWLRLFLAFCSKLST
jgi:hypothetical protein